MSYFWPLRTGVQTGAAHGAARSATWPQPADLGSSGQQRVLTCEVGRVQT